jgi:hypothetical protein
VVSGGVIQPRPSEQVFVLFTWRQPESPQFGGIPARCMPDDKQKAHRSGPKCFVYW